MKHATFPDLRQRTTDECLHHMPAVARLASDEWARGFASSILRQSRRKGWNPTPKQLGMMRRMVAELFQLSGDDDLIVIE